jgi:RNA polymerase sigma-70 factor (ECF subfamily)
MRPTEKDIITGCENGDRKAQKALYETHKNQMYTLAFRITGNREEAEDVLVEGFMKVFKYLKTFKFQSELATWIHTIVARTAYAKIRNRVHFDDIDNHSESDLDLIEVPDDMAYLEKVIMDLPTGYRTVFTLYEVEGYKHREIAEILEISENTSKSQLSKAKALLREKITRQ